jgi:hypothetical protein
MVEQRPKQFADVEQADKDCEAAWGRLATRHDEIGALLGALPDTYIFHVTPYGEDAPVSVSAKEFKACYFGLQWSMADAVANNGGVGQTASELDVRGNWIGGTTKILPLGLIGADGASGYDATPASRALLCLHETAHATGAGRAMTLQCWTHHLASEADKPYDQTSGAWYKNERLANDIAKAVASVLKDPHFGHVVLAPNPIGAYSDDKMLVATDTAQAPKTGGVA